MAKLVVVLLLLSQFIFSQEDNSNLYHRSLKDIEIDNQFLRSDPPSGPLCMPAEFSKAEGVFLSYKDYQKKTIRDIALEVVKDIEVYMVVGNNELSAARDYFLDGGVDMEKVHFIETNDPPGIWIRDFGPFYSYNNIDRAITNANYYANHIPPLIADTFGFECFETTQMISGGNFMTDGNGMGFCSDTEFSVTPVIRKRFKEYFGIDSLICVPKIWGDGTGHIDMASKLINDTTIFVGSYMDGAAYYENNQAILDENAETFSRLKNLEGREFRVVRFPMPEVTNLSSPEGNTRSYLNSLIFNKTVLVPTYNIELDSVALDLYRSEMPGYNVVGIDSEDIINYWGAIHCITNTHFKDNPLVITHTPPQGDYISNDEIPLEFTISPGSNQFGVDRSGFINYREVGEIDFIQISVEPNKGVWRDKISSTSGDIEYFLSGEVNINSSKLFTVRYPEEPDSLITIEVESVGTEEQVVRNFSLEQNYPNPFNPTTTINYQVANDGEISLAVFNLNGEIVEEIVKGNQKAGNYSIEFDGTNLSSGVYYYTIVGEGFRATKKMILLK